MVDLLGQVSLTSLSLAMIELYVQMVIILLLYRSYKRKPEVAMAAFFNRGKKAFIIFGISALAYSITQIVGLIVSSVVYPSNTERFYMLFSAFFGIGGNILIGFTVAIWMLKKIIDESL